MAKGVKRKFKAHCKGCDNKFTIYTNNKFRPSLNLLDRADYSLKDCSHHGIMKVSDIKSIREVT